MPLVSDRCYFKNPQTTEQPLCGQLVEGIDYHFRSYMMSDMFPVDEQTVRAFVDKFGEAGKSVWEPRHSIDVIVLKLVDCPNADGLSSTGIGSAKFWAINCVIGHMYSKRRKEAILSALGPREEYRTAVTHRLSQIAQGNVAGVSAENPLMELFSVLVVGAAAMAAVAFEEESERAEVNAADPKWIGHENDELCYLEYVDYVSGRRKVDTHCLAYNGSIRHIPVSDSAEGSLIVAVGTLLFKPDRCSGVEGWCRPR